MHHAGLAAVRRRPAERLHVDQLAGHRLHDIRPGDEDPALRSHDHDVRQRRPVRGAAGGRAEHDGDLRDPAGRSDDRGEHRADAVQRLHALGQPRAAGVPQADHRDALAHRGVDRVDDVPAALVPHGTAHAGAVGAERDDLRAVDPAAHRPHPGRVGGVQALQRARVEQRREPHLGFPRVDRARRARRRHGGSSRGRLRLRRNRPGRRLLGRDRLGGQGFRGLRNLGHRNLGGGRVDGGRHDGHS